MRGFWGPYHYTEKSSYTLAKHWKVPSNILFLVLIAKFLVLSNFILNINDNNNNKYCNVGTYVAFSRLHGSFDGS